MAISRKTLPKTAADGISGLAVLASAVPLALASTGLPAYAQTSNATIGPNYYIPKDEAQGSGGSAGYNCPDSNGLHAHAGGGHSGTSGPTITETYTNNLSAGISYDGTFALVGSTGGSGGTGGHSNCSGGNSGEVNGGNGAGGEPGAPSRSPPKGLRQLLLRQRHHGLQPGRPSRRWRQYGVRERLGRAWSGVMTSSPAMRHPSCPWR